MQFLEIFLKHYKIIKLIFKTKALVAKVKFDNKDEF